MSLELNQEENLNDGIKRIIIGELTYVIEIINENHKQNPHYVIHEIRKSMKKLRACYRLIRFSIDNYKTKNIFYRDIARSVSETRDATSVIEAFHLLKEQFKDNLYKNAFDDLEKYLNRRRKQISSKILDEDDMLSSIKITLEEELNNIRDSSFNLIGFESIEGSIHKVYNRGKKGLKRSVEETKTENFHEWRKRAKYLRYHLRILERIWPSIMDELEEELHVITDLLGHDHDLAIIDELVKTQAGIFKNDSDRSLFNGLVREQRKNLQFYAIRLGERFYFDEPDHFVNRLHQYWDSHQKEIEVTGIPQLEVLEY